MYIQCGLSRGLTAGVEPWGPPGLFRPHGGHIRVPFCAPPPMGLNNGISFDIEVLYQSGTQAGWRKVWD